MSFEAKLETDPIKSSPAQLPDLLFPFLDLKAQFATIKNDVTHAISRVMDNQHFILGKEVEAFEKDVAEVVGVREAVGCASGSDALLLALMALEVEPGDEVITTPFTFVATGGSVARLGAKPVFADIEPDTFNLDPSQIDCAITSRTRAIIPVHLFGLTANVDPILEVAKGRGISVIEDAAQALGARCKGKSAGSMSRIGCFSFFPSKNLGGAGDGGMMTTDDIAVADRLRTLRGHGAKKKYYSELIGMNSRLDSLQAAILRVKLPYLSRWVSARRNKAEKYKLLIEECGLQQHITIPDAPGEFFHAYNQFTIRVPKRNQVRDFLRARGIPTETYYPYPLHLQPAFAYLRYRQGAFPVAEAACDEVLSLPVYPELEERNQVAVVRALADFFGTARAQTL
jgi:dTDP-4-amino-4,6-dideoxygalactose transaminase